MVTQPVQACRIPFLKRWTPDSHFFGLVVTEQGLALNPSVFSCCGGDGVLVDPQNPREASLCGLTRRWNLLFNLLKAWSDMRITRNETGRDGHFEPLWSDDRATSNRRVKSLDALFKRHLDGFLRSEKGAIIGESSLTTALKSSDDRLPWLAAATMAWHFETLILMTKIGVSPLPFLHWTEMLAKHPRVRVIVMVESVSELWLPNRLESLEAIISFASERLLPIWLFEAGGHQSLTNARGGEGAVTPEKPRSFKMAMNKRMTAIKSKSIGDWLSEQGRSRLSEICDITAPVTQGSGIPDFV
jgi:hypothetical protein